MGERMNDALMELRDVAFAYPGRPPVLDGASLELKPGERVALAGANGSGKTTVLHLLVGLLRPSAGEIAAFGRTRTSETEFDEVRRRAGLLFQDSDDQLFCATVAEDLAFGPFNLGVPRADTERRVQTVLDRIGLPDFGGRVTYRLSAGEKRLVALGTILTMEPEVLLLDEPSNGLDETARERLLAILASLPQAMILVSHDTAFVDRLATRRAVLHAGRIEAAR